MTDTETLIAEAIRETADFLASLVADPELREAELLTVDLVASNIADKLGETSIDFYVACQPTATPELITETK